MAFTEGQNYSSENFFHAFPFRQTSKIFGSVGPPDMSKHLKPFAVYLALFFYDICHVIVILSFFYHCFTPGLRVFAKTDSSTKKSRQKLTCKSTSATLFLGNALRDKSDDTQWLRYLEF